MVAPAAKWYVAHGMLVPLLLGGLAWTGEHSGDFSFVLNLLLRLRRLLSIWDTNAAVSCHSGVFALYWT